MTSEQLERQVRYAKEELEAQRERGEWSGLVSTSGAPIYTLSEIADAVAARVAEQKDVR